ncbi:MAG TPA: SDR family oxidoreductase, partial [Ilumatobacteraceae bacterium]|nr:SDR family oxidoreductase [Ilumatobacteraceae bacterium]
MAAEMPPSWLTPASVMLTGKVGVVTGAGAGIGKGVATALARFGADVAICDRDEATLEQTRAEIEELGVRVLAHHLDVRNGDGVTRWLADIGTEFGRVDIVVNNAGGTFQALFADTTAKGEETLIRENFTSATDVIRKALPLISDGASIINITSIEAWRGCPGLSIYGAMKAALENVTLSLALELGDRGIRVNTIAPDSIVSPGGQDVATRPPSEFTLPGLGKGSYVPMTPLRFIGDPDDVAA